MIRVHLQVTYVLALMPTGMLLREVSCDNEIAEIFIVHHHHASIACADVSHTPAASERAMLFRNCISRSMLEFQN